MNESEIEQKLYQRYLDEQKYLLTDIEYGNPDAVEIYKCNVEQYIKKAQKYNLFDPKKVINTMFDVFDTILPDYNSKTAVGVLIFFKYTIEQYKIHDKSTIDNYDFFCKDSLNKINISVLEYDNYCSVINFLTEVDDLERLRTIKSNLLTYYKDNSKYANITPLVEKLDKVNEAINSICS